MGFQGCQWLDFPFPEDYPLPGHDHISHPLYFRKFIGLKKWHLVRDQCDRSQESGICVSCALSCFLFMIVHCLGATFRS